MVDHKQEMLNRLVQLLQLVEKEDVHLQAVRQRLFGDIERFNEEWVSNLKVNPEGIDRLESFGAKFGRMQDTIVDKLLPQLLKVAGEKSGTVIDNLGRAERLHLVGHSDDWISMRGLRNMLVHEYIESPSEMLIALQQARDFTEQLHDTFEAILKYAQNNLGINLLLSPES